ncbi:hypothetical protein PVAND_004918 [Polypedilum vanderplanki]|uniref:Uncharacterized protein n=1 Tax=Polypedilum vanderplanki TaxID=319348 RepID=A0A9J6BYP3_POLVA|nr:hypothetical protein PVAND_004918 [Polypedilum vanderplanki]
MTLWPALGNVDQILAIIEVRGQRRAISSSFERTRNDFSDLGTVEMGMKTAETQTELIDSESSHNSPLGFNIINENTTSDNNNDKHLNINSLKDMKDLRCIDDDSASGHRILFTGPDNPETKL